MALMLERLDLLGMHDQPAGGEPMLLPVDTIDEDPAQPRIEFDEGPLRELAQTIRERGVRQPISVRPSPTDEGRWLLNFGARRLRAARLAARADIPAFVDLGADSYDQIIENEQRERLKPLELALFVQRRLAVGESQAEIARRMGKSRAYVTYATALIDAPDWLMAAYREGRCCGLRELYELRLAASKPGFDARAWVGAQASITRSALRELGLPRGKRADKVDSKPTAGVARASIAGSRETSPVPVRSLHVMAGHRGEPVEVRLDRVPDAKDQVFVRASDGAPWMSVPIAGLDELRLRVVEGEGPHLRS